MELINCKKCGRTFGSTDGEQFCKKCREVELDELFKVVRDYLYANPGASVEEVHDKTGIEKRVIIKFLRDERIEIVEDENALLTCQRCGVSIKTGKFCNKCKHEIDRELRSAVHDLQHKAHDRRDSDGPRYHSKKK
ncbi:MAG: flagellar protein [Peptostreptococcaceae bacterium]|jgi:flagellar operon protein (TIGR03826 family)|nr:flagellar protein [Peptostreptococcaceae bacterium]